MEEEKEEEFLVSLLMIQRCAYNEVFIGGA